MNNQAPSDLVRRVAADNWYGSADDKRMTFRQRLAEMGRRGGLKAAANRRRKKEQEARYKASWYYREMVAE